MTPAGIKVIFDSDWNPVQRACEFIAGNCLIAVTCLDKRSLQPKLNDRIQLRNGLFNASEIGAGYFLA